MPRPTESQPPADPIPTQLLDGRYRLETVIGRGGMGVVYRAIDERLDRIIAVKVLRDSSSTNEARFLSEVRTLARFVHPNLVRLLDAGEFAEQSYLVMDFVEGPTLAQRLASGPLAKDEVAKIGANVASALAYVHAAGIVHRDVKPANVLLDHNGNAHLADFGIARLVDTTGLSATGLTIGTPAYLAPEQVQGAGLTAAVDVYALGLVLLECLTGRRAFEGTPTEVTAARLGRDPVLPPDLDPAWRAILRSMTTREPTERVLASEVVTTLSERPTVGEFAFASTDGSTLPSGDTTQLLPSLRGGDTEALVAPPELDTTRTALATDRFGGLSARLASAPQMLLYGGIGLVLVVFALLLAFVVFAPAPGPGRDPGAITASSSTTSVPTSSTSTSTTTTSTPVPTLAAASSSLQSALEAGVANGTVAPPAAQQLDNQLQALLFQAPNTPPQKQVDQFAQLVQSVDNDVANGQVSGSATSSVTAAINELAGALGTTVPTTTVPSSLPPGGGGHGHGKGQGDGGG